MSMPVVFLSDLPWDARGPEADRVRDRAAACPAARVVSPPGAESPEGLPPNVVWECLDVPVGLPLEKRAAVVAEAAGPFLDALRPRVVHAFGLPLAVTALLRTRSGLRTVVEPGVTPVQRLRDEDPDTAAARLADLVALEDKTLARADAVIAHTPIEAATLGHRGVTTERLHVVPDRLPGGDAALVAPPDLPHVVFVGDLAPWSGWEVLLEALARLKLPWRATLVFEGEGGVGAVAARARALGLEGRLHALVGEREVGLRVDAAQVVVAALSPSRAVDAGAVVPAAVGWALARGRPLVAPDLPVVQALALGAAETYGAGDPGSLAAALRRVLTEPDRRVALVERGAEVAAGRRRGDPEAALRALWARLSEGA